jgi:hypothetical protein
LSLCAFLIPKRWILSNFPQRCLPQDAGMQDHLLSIVTAFVMTFLLFASVITHLT